jgi:hypothetical protein
VCLEEDGRVTERPPGAGPPTEVPAEHAPLVGVWRKTTTDACAQAYPDEIEFFEHRFLARKGPGQEFLRWDVGGYQVTGVEEIRMSTASDERVVYGFGVEAGELWFRDPDGCRVAYARATSSGEGGR